jgi:hypothetical protein
MQVNLVIDDNLLQQAMQVSGLATIPEVIEKALQSLIVPPAPASSEKDESAKPKTRRIGALKGRITIAEDFEVPLPEEIMSAFRGGQPSTEA